MALTDEEIRADRKIDLLYKNLEHVSSAYFAAEGVYPSWEAAFALIVGQIFIAYYSGNLCPSQQSWLVAFGFILSAIWFIIVSLNLQYALHIERETRKLQNMIDDEMIKSESCRPEFVRPWVWGKKDWKIGNIFWGTLPNGAPVGRKTWLETVLKSTWFYRRLLPFILCLIWISFFNIYTPIFIVIVIILWSSYFKFKLDLQPNL